MVSDQVRMQAWFSIMAMKSQRACGSIPWFVVALETEIRGFQRRHTLMISQPWFVQDTDSAAQCVASFLEYFGLRLIRQHASAVATPHPREHKKNLSCWITKLQTSSNSTIFTYWISLMSLSDWKELTNHIDSLFINFKVFAFPFASILCSHILPVGTCCIGSTLCPSSFSPPCIPSHVLLFRPGALRKWDVRI